MLSIKIWDVIILPLKRNFGLEKIYLILTDKDTVNESSPPSPKWLFRCHGFVKNFNQWNLFPYQNLYLLIQNMNRLLLNGQV